MPDETILDIYSRDVEAPRTDQYSHFFPGAKRTLSTEEFFQRTSSLSEALSQRGVRAGDRVLLLSENRPEWHIVDLAVLALGAVDVPIYTTLTPEQIAYQAKDSGAVVAITETAEHTARVLGIKDECPDLKHVFQIEDHPVGDAVPIAEIIDAASEPKVDGRFWDRAKKVSAEDLASIVYTSGTTGEPKGVMLSHRNFVSNVNAVMPRVPLTRDDLGLEFLPLCHVFERTVGYAYMQVSTRRAYCSAHHIADLLGIIAPTVFASVPRLYEKIYAAIMSKVEAAPVVRRALFHWAEGVGWKAAQHRLSGSSPGLFPGLVQHLADRLVLSKVRKSLGGRIRFSISGGAPLPLYVNQFFHSMGLPIQEGYGLTETSPAIGIAGFHSGKNRLGSIGKGLENLDIQLAEDGELLVKGPSVSRGYWNKPLQTAEVFDDDGYFHTGDIARIDEDGFIFITDRKKDLIVTAGGKNVAPQPVEAELKRSPFVEYAALIGDRRPYIVALLFPAQDVLEQWGKERALGFSTLEELVAQPEVVRLFADVVDAANAKVARYEQVKQFRIVPATLTVEGGQLTPTMKVRRKAIERDFSTTIEELYRGAHPAKGR